LGFEFGRNFLTEVRTDVAHQLQKPIQIALKNKKDNSFQVRIIKSSAKISNSDFSYVIRIYFYTKYIEFFYKSLNGQKY
jgi:hypothetical protein